MEGKQFNIKLIGTTLIEREVPLNVFIKTLEGVQQTIYELGNSRLNDMPLGRGRKPQILQEHCELFLLKAEPGSLDAVLTMPPSREDLASSIQDFPELVLDDFKEVIKSIVNQDKSMLQKVIKSQPIRKKVVNIINKVLPSHNTDYAIDFNFDANDHFVNVIKLAPDQVLDFIGDETTENIENDDYVEVQARIKARLSENGELDIKNGFVLDYKLTVDLRPYRADFIVWEKDHYLLAKEIVATADIEEGYIILEYEPLNITAYGETREEAIEAFKEEFSVLYRNYCDEKDDNLTIDAIELKKRLKGLVKGVQHFENCQS